MSSEAVAKKCECHWISYYMQKVFETGLNKLGRSIWECPMGSILFAIFLTIIGSAGLFYFQIESKLSYIDVFMDLARTNKMTVI